MKILKKPCFSVLALFAHTRTDSEKTEIVIQLRPDGSRGMVWTDKFPIADLGQPKVARASNIEWSEEFRMWEVTMTHENFVRFRDPSRDVCVKWEVDYIHENFANVLNHHFPLLPA